MESEAEYSGPGSLWHRSGEDEHSNACTRRTFVGMAWEARVTACNRQTATREREGRTKRGLTRKEKRINMLTNSERERARRVSEASVGDDRLPLSALHFNHDVDN